MKKCPNCEAANLDDSNFCSSCGFSFATSKKTAEDNAGPFIGEKSVSAADIIGVGNQLIKTMGGNYTHTDRTAEGNAGPFIGEKSLSTADIIGVGNRLIKTMGGNYTHTEIHNSIDDTKSLFICTKCRGSFLKTSGYCCQKCGGYACESHFDKENNLCYRCLDEIEERNASEYEKLFITYFQDSKIDPQERKKLNEEMARIGLSEEKAISVEEKIKDSIKGMGDNFSPIEKWRLNRAKELLTEKYDLVAAENEFGDLFTSHPENEDVVRLYLIILMERDPQKYQKLYVKLPDVIDKYLLKVELLSRKKEFDEAYKTLAEAKIIFINDEKAVQLKEIELLLDIYKEKKDKTLLECANEKFNEINNIIGGLSNKFDYLPQMLFLKSYIDYLTGDKHALDKGERECISNNISPIYFKRKNQIIEDYLREAQEKVRDKDVETAIWWYEKASELGHIESQHILGNIYFNDKKYFNVQRAKYWYEKAALQGHVKSQQRLGFMFYLDFGHTGDKNSILKSKEWYKKAAERNDAESQYRLGRIFSEGPKAERNIEESEKWLQRSAEQKYYPGIIQLCKFFESNNEFSKAMKWYERLAAEGKELALFKLGEIYYKGKGCIRNYKKAAEYYEKAAEINHNDSKNRLGEMYLNGYGVEKSVKRALGLFKEAAKENNELSQFNLGEMNFTGNGIERNYSEAKKWFIKAAENDHTLSQRYLGLIYLKGLGTEVNYNTAKEWLESAAEQEDSESQYLLGNMYLNGCGVKKDTLSIHQAIKWYEKAAENDDVKSMRELGEVYLSGVRCPVDYKLAFEWFSRAADQNDAKSKYYLGVIYENGHGVEKDYSQAREWYEQAALEGSSEGQLKLGMIYSKGLVVEASAEKAREWLEKAAASGNEEARKELNNLNAANVSEIGAALETSTKTGFEQNKRNEISEYAEEQYQMGLRCKNAEGRDRDEKKAFDFFLLAAEGNHVKAQLEVARAYQFGKGTAKNANEAFKWFQRAAEAGDDAAQYGLGMCYLNGWGTSVNEEEAFQWLDRAAGQNNVLGQYNVGMLYLQGKGTGKSEEKAIYWLKKAAAKNNVLAVQELKKRGN